MLHRVGIEPLADRLERLTNELVNKAESEMVASVETSHEAYLSSQNIVFGFQVGSVLLALTLEGDEWDVRPRIH